VVSRPEFSARVCSLCVWQQFGVAFMSGFGGVVDRPTDAPEDEADGVKDETESPGSRPGSGGGGGNKKSGGGAAGQSIMSLRRSLGVSGFCLDTVVFSAPTTVAYPLGKQIVFHDTTSGEMRYLARSRTARPVTSMAIDSTLASLAVCEQSSADVRAQIHIIHCSMMKKTRTISSQVPGDIVGCAFASSGSRELVTLSFTGDDYTITLWKWAQSKVLASVNTNINVSAGQSIRRIRFKPNDTIITTSGSKHLRLWTLDSNNGVLRGAPMIPLKREQDNFIEQVWVKGSDCLVVVTSERLLSFKVSSEGCVR
jgi:WD40 repeat protein